MKPVLNPIDMDTITRSPKTHFIATKVEIANLKHRLKFIQRFCILFAFFIVSSYTSQAQMIVNLTINKQATTYADPGDLITYTIDYANLGGLNADSVVIIDYLPPSEYYTYFSSVPEGIYDTINRTITWTKSEILTLTLLGGGSNPPIVVKVIAGIPGDSLVPSYDSAGFYMPYSDTFNVKNSVSIFSRNAPTPINNSDSTEVIQYCDVLLTLPDSGEVKSSGGASITYLGTIINTGNINNFFTFDTIIDLGTVPPGGNPQYTHEILNTNFQPIDSTGWLAPNEVFYFYFRMTVIQSPANKYHSVQIFVKDSVCGSTTVDSATMVTKVHNPGKIPIVNFFKSDFPDPVRSGDTLSYTLSVSNSSNEYAATSVTLNEFYDSRVTFDTAIPNYPTIGDSIWNIGTIPANGVWSTLVKVVVDYNLPSGTTVLTNNASLNYLAGTTPYVKTASATTTVVSAPDVKITKYATHDTPLLPGDTVTYTIVYENIGNFTATYDTITDDYDETYIAYFTDHNGGDTLSSPGKIIWSVGTLAPFAKDSIVYTVKIKDASAFPTTAGQTVIVNTANIILSEVDEDYSNNSASAYVIVSLLPNMKITKTATPTPAEAGQSLTYTITVENIGNYDAENDSIIVRDTLPSNVTISSIGNGGTEISPGVIQWPDTTDLDIGDSFSRSVIVIPDCPVSATDSLENKVIVFGKLSDADISDNVYTLKTKLVDAEDPTVVCPSDQTRDAITGECYYTVVGIEFDTVSASDNCGVASVENDFNSTSTLAGAQIPVGITTITWTVTDVNGNTNTCDFDVTVNDSENPIITCSVTADQNVGTNNLCTYVHSGTTWDATASDNCNVASIEYALTGATTGTGTSLNNEAFNLGTTTVTWTATDDANNTDVCSFDVIVADDDDPVITCGVTTDQNVNTNNLCTYVHSGTTWDATASDNCNVASIEYALTGATTGTGTSLNNEAFNLGTTTVTWTATDDANNTDVCSFDVIVADDDDPVITCGVTTNQNVGTNNLCTYVHSGTTWDATASDNCNVASIEYALTGATTGTGTSLNNKVFNLGTTTVTWTATDDANNTDVCSFDVIVADDDDPVITCGVTTNQNVGTNNLCTYVHSGTTWDATASDNCNVASIEYALTGATTGTGTSLENEVFNLGTTTVTWTATDDANNTDVCSFDVIVADDDDPVITCGVTTDQNVNTNNLCTYVHSGTTWDATASDNCNVASIEYALTGATTGTGTSLNNKVFNLGTTTVTWTATDDANNTDVCSFDVIVADNDDPVITCGVMADQNVNTNNLCTYVHSGTTWDATASDNCNVASIEYALTGATTGTGTSLDNEVFNLGTTTVTWTATDDANNTDVCSFDVIVADDDDPVITCGVTTNQNVGTNNLCTYVHSGTTWDATASDNCNVASIEYALTGATTGTGTSLNNEAFNLGTTTVTWTATDDANNTDVCSFDVIVADDDDPVITCGVTADQNVGTNNLCTYVHSGTTWDATASDNCNVASIEYALTGTTTGTGTSLNNKVFNLGTTTVTWTATDDANNTDVCSFDIIVADDDDPVITCGVTADQNVNTNNLCTYVHSGTTWDATASDNCNVASIEYALTGATTGTGTSLNNEVFNLGTTTVTWTATDDANNTDVCSFDIIVADDDDPVITCGVTTDQNVGTNNLCTYVHSGTTWDATASDNCNVASIEYTLTGATTGTGTSLNNEAFNLGTTTVTWTATDDANNTDVCSFDVIVADDDDPVITCGVTANQNVGTNNLCTYVHSGTTWDATASDNCNVASIEYALTGATTGTGTSLNNEVFNLGTTTVTWTATDDANNTDVCSFNVIVADDDDPVITCGVTTDQNVNTNNLCTYVHSGTTWDATASDNCNVASIEYALTGATTGTGTSLNNKVFNLGTTTVTWTATDDANNTDVCSFDVIVADDDDPVITCGVTADQNVNTNNLCTYVHSGTTWDATASDNCNVASIEYALTGATTGTGTSLNNEAFNLGTTTVTWTATDDANNTDVCSFDVIVADDDDPVITCGVTANQNVGTNNLCTYVHSGTTWDATASDNCNVASIEYALTGATTGTGTSLDNEVFNLGTTTVTWTATDDANNTDVCSFDVIVADDDDPVITCGVTANQNVNTNNLCTYVHSGTTWDATASDNCNVASIEYALTGATTGTGTSLDNEVFNLGTTTVTWTATDDANNTDVCSFDVIVDDDDDPVITCGVTTDQNVNTNNLCTYVHSGTTWDATASDNCNVASIEYALTGATTGTGTSLNNEVFNLGTTTVTWTATDDANNTDVCSFDVIVADDDDPVITCGVTANQNVGTNNLCTYVHSGTTWDATASDNCNVASIEYALTGATTGTGTSLDNEVFNLGTTTVTWTATDDANNTDVCSFDIIVADDDDPVITCGVTANQNVGTNNLCTYVHSGTTWDATASDNCNVASIEYALTGATTGTGTSLNNKVFNLGTTTVTWTATDDANNTDVCSFDVIVADDDDPVITCGVTADQNVNTNNLCTYVHSGTTWDATASDNCNVASIEYALTGATTGTGTSLNNKVFNLGTTTVTWTATDDANNTDVCSFDVIVADDDDPVITCGVTANQNVGTNNLCTYVHSGTTWDATASDNCNVASIEYALTGATTGTGTSLNNEVFNLGTTTVTWTATDDANNTDVCSFDVIVADDDDPVITCGVTTDQNVNTNNLCTYVHSGTTWDATASDNCNVASIEYALTGATTGTGTSLNNEVFNLGTTTVTWTATDDANNTDVCSFDVIVADDDDPVITCGVTTDQNVNTNNLCTYVHSGTTWDATASDNCNVASIEYALTGATTGTGTSLNNEAFNLGTTTVTWTATDDANNTDVCSFDVIVADDDDPVITCGVTTDQNVNTNNLCTYVHSGTTWDATASDNCNVASIEYTLTGATTGTGTSLNNEVFNLGTTTVTWTATDDANNTDVCSFDVIVADDDDPVITCGVTTDQNVNTNNLCTYVHSGTTWDATASDNCNVASIEYALTGATTGTGTSLNNEAFNLGTTTVTWTATDDANNTDVCSFDVIVADDDDPVITCGVTANQNVGTNNLCTYVHSGTTWDATASDNCNVASIEYALTGATTGTGTSLDNEVFNLGTTTVTWTATDDANNTDVCSFDVIVADDDDPVITCGVTTDQNVNTNNLCTYVHSGTTWDATASDNCNVASIEYALTGATTGTGTSLNNEAFNLGTTTVTWTATDDANNTDVCSFDVIVDDDDDPVITCGVTANQNVNTNNLCTYVHSGTTWDATASDNCNVASIEYALTGATTGTGTSLNNEAFNLGTTTVTWTATDDANNTDVCSFDVIVADDDDPVITCGVTANQNVNTNNLCTYVHSGTTWDATASDNCNVASIEYTLTGATTGTGTSLNNKVFNLGTTTVTWTATDDANNTDVCSFDVIVADDDDPVITCGVTANQNVGTNNLCTYVHSGTTWDATASDNCNVASIEYALTGATTGTGTSLDNKVFNLGTTTVTWTATDDANNTDVCSFDIIVADDDDPVITCGVTANQNVGTNNLCTYVHSGTTWDATASDNCNVASIEYALTGATTGTGTSLNNEAFNLGTTTVTWTATDDANNTDVCSFDVIVADDDDPVITCGVTTDQNVNTNNLCTYVHSGTTWDATASDNCNVASIEYALTGATTGTGTSLNNEVFNLGTTTVTWTATDDANNTDVCSFDVIVADDDDPVITCGVTTDQNVNTNNLCTYVHSGTTWDATASDNCNVASIEYALTGATTGTGTSLNNEVFNLGTTTVTWTATDDANNTDVCSFDVIVADDDDPVITCGVTANQNVGTNNLCTYVHSGTTWDATASDNCNVASIEYALTGATTGTGTSLDNEVFNLGTTTVTWTATDDANNTDVCSFDVIVADDDDPVITCPANVTVNTDNGLCTASSVALGTPVTDDNCTVADVSNDAPVTFPLGNTTVTWTVTDGSGNTAQCTQTVTVDDNENPTITCPANVAVNTDNGLCTASSVALGTPVTDDNCTVADVSNDAPVTFPLGNTTVTWTVTDGSGNTAQCTQTVTVDDNENPTITCPANVAVNTDNGLCTASSVALGTPVTDDNCTVADVSNDAPATFPLGNTTVTWIVTDGAGNTAQCTQTVTVDDNENPTITCPANVAVNTDNGLCTASSVALGTPVTDDNCSVADVSNDAPVTFPLGNTAVTWIVTDGAGNTAQCTQTVTVDDNENPTITCPANVVVNTDNGLCTASSVDLGNPVTDDNCSVADVSNDAPAMFPLGNTTVTWTVIDGAGNTAQCTQTVTVDDNENPTITCPADVAVNTDNGLCTASNVALGNPVTDDNCSVADVSNDAPVTFPLGNSIVTWTVTDGAGNTAQCTQTVTVDDNENPTITCPANVAVNTDNGLCTASNVALGNPVTDDNCSVADVSNDAPVTFPLGNTTVTWTVTDGAGNTAQCTQTVTVDDNENPTITCPADMAVNTDNGLCTASSVALGAPVTDDNCSVADVSNDAPVTFPLGNTTVTWTVTDGSGNTAQCTQTVTVDDNENPTITCPADVAVNTDNGLCTASSVALGTPVTDDNCTVADVSNDAPATFPLGNTTVTWTVTDGAGNTAQCTQTVTVDDNENPTITCPDDVAVNTDIGLCTASSVALGTPVTDDNCSVANVSNDAPATFPLGNTTVTWTVTDGSGNTAQCTQTVTVDDNENPTITCPANVAVNTDNGLCTASNVALGTPVTDDNCSVADVSNDAPATFPLGNTTVTWTVTDGSGNTAQCTQTVTVDDNEDPTITCPADITVNTDTDDCIATGVVLGTPATSDNCAVDVVSNNAPGFFGLGTTTVTWTVIDAAGNSATCTQTVTVVDNQNPTITCPADLAINTDNGVCFASNVDLGNPVADDNCTVADVSNDAPATFPLGNTTVTWTVIDGAGNTAQCTQTVTVDDNENPTITCPADVAVNTDNGLCTASSVALGTPVTDDNCSVADVSNDAPVMFPLGSTTVTWTVIDGAGNTAQCTQTVTVDDNENPTITCPADVAVNTDNGLCTASSVDLGTPVTDDNCSVADVSNDAPVTFPLGSTTVTWTVTDGAGNIAQCTQTVTVDDNENPTITCPADVAVNTDNGLCTASSVDLGTPVTDDNCSVADVSNDAPVTFPLGNTIVTWTVTDGAGNTALCTQTVTVDDNENPTITCPADVAVNTDNGLCTASNVALGNPVTDDNCSVADLSNDAPATFPLGNTIVTWIVTDGSGNTAQCTQTVTVDDNENPTITCPADVAVNTDNGLCTASNVALGTPVTDDNCSVADVSNDAPDTFLLGNTTVTWTVTDGAGNTAQCTQTVTVDDNENPTITCPADVAVNTDNGLCTASNVALGNPVTDDNCSVADVSNDAPVTFPLGSTTVTWTVTDGAGNTAQCTQTVTVDDNENPTITCPADVAVNTDNGLCSASNVALGTPVTDDNCSVADVSNDAPATFPLGNTTVTWTVTDGAGNTAQCTQTVTVDDNENPTITCPVDITVNTDAGLCSASNINLGGAVTDDNCSVADVSNDAPATFQLGATSVIWTVTDGSGNTAQCIQTVTVIDNENPSITCPVDLTVNTDNGVCSASNVALGTPVTDDNCSVADVSNDAPATFPLGNTTVTWTVTDGAGNTAQCTQTVTVDDNENPIITCPADVAVNTDNGLCTASNVALGTPVTDDNCTVADVSNDAPATFPLGNTTVTWTVTDGAGNTAQCTQTVTVDDNENPTITCPVDITVNTDAGLCSASNINLGGAVTNDNCSVADVSNDAPATFQLGATSVIWTVTDGSGNTAQCTQTVTVIDNENPSITCPVDLTVNTDNGVCSASNVALGNPVTDDNCSVADVSNDAPVTFQIGTTTVTWTVTDGSGNSAFCTQSVTVIDNENPTIVCPGDITQGADAGVCNAYVNVPLPSTNDNCGVQSVTNSFNGTSNASGEYPVGTTIVTWTVTDISGNSASCAMLVTVIDTEEPTIECPLDIVQGADPGSCEAYVNVPVPVTSDNCGVQWVTNSYTGSNNASDVYPVGTTTVVWTIIDFSGNTATCSMTVTVYDTEAPTIVCPDNITVNNDPGLCEAFVTVPSPTVWDNCEIQSITNDFNGTADASGDYQVGTTTVVWTVTDASGNSISCTMEITVIDNESPAITCPENIIQDTDPGVCEAFVFVPEPSIDDNCGISSIVNDYNGTANASDTYPIGNTTIEWTVLDINGNTNTCVMTITITDNENPTIECPADIDQSTDPDVCEAFVTVDIPVTGDNCGVASIINDFNNTGNASGIYPLGSTTVTWTVTDIHGNLNTCSMNITVTDDELPEIICPDDIATLSDAGVCEAFVEIDIPMASDNCGVATLINNYNNTGNASDIYPVGATTVVWTVTDQSGNINTCSMTITITDEENPTIICPANIDQSTDPGVCEALVTVNIPVTNDNCGVAEVINDINGTGNASGVYPVGTTTITWTVTDIYGNFETCIMDVTVMDTELPTIVCPADITQTADENVCEAFVTVDAPVVSDNCGITSIVNDYNGTEDASDTYPVGATTVTWTTTDIHGNVNTCAMVITIEDDQSPSIECPEDIAVSTDPASCEANIEVPSPVTGDNCGVSSVINDYNGTANASDIYQVGTTLVTWTVTDIHGNSTTCQMNITVTDDESPTVTCPDDFTITSEPGVCEAFISMPDPGTSDNCGVESIVNDYNGSSNASDIYVTGQTTVTWTVTDLNGNTGNCSFTITVLSPPLANDDFVNTLQDVPVDVDILANDIDCENSLDPSTLTIITEPLYGTVYINVSMGNISYHPNAAFSGLDSLRYKICNADGLCSQAIVYLAVDYVNYPPVANDDYDTTLMDYPKVIDVLANDYDPNGEGLFVSICGGPQYGEVYINEDQTITYSPDFDFIGSDTICYIACDNGYPTLCDTAVVYITVVPDPGREVEIIVYNTLTPNGDGKNDFVYIKGIKFFPENELTMFNRWGDGIKVIQGYDNGIEDKRWNGNNKNGKPLPAGTYFYILKVDKLQEIFSGWIYLHR